MPDSVYLKSVCRVEFNTQPETTQLIAAGFSGGGYQFLISDEESHVVAVLRSMGFSPESYRIVQFIDQHDTGWL